MTPIKKQVIDPELLKVIKAAIPYNRFVVYDFEWKPTGQDDIWAASFVDSDGFGWVLHIDDYRKSAGFLGNPQVSLLVDICKTLLSYRNAVGFGNIDKGSDNTVLHNNLKRYKLNSIVVEDMRYDVFIDDIKCIDLHKIFSKKLLQFSTFENAYRDVKLDTVGKFFVGMGKYEGYDGLTIQQAPYATQVEYSLRDSLVTMLLLAAGMKKGDKVNKDGMIIKLMVAITKIIEDSRILNGIPEDKWHSLSFENVCHTNLTTWWKYLMRNNGFGGHKNCQHCRVVARYKANRQILKDDDFEGGAVEDPEIGYYLEIAVIDVQSLYPTMAIKYNISPETVCCDCCRDDPEAEISTDIIKQRDGTPYWICRKHVGIFARLQKEGKDLRVKFKKENNDVMSNGLKILLNGGYGVFGAKFFAFNDYGVAELITALGRWTNRVKIRPIAEKLGFRVLYGDTDSSFLNYIKPEGFYECPKCKFGHRRSSIDSLCDQVKEALDIVVEYEKDFVWLELIKKKHYMGRLSTGKLLVKGMEGKKGDRCKWIRDNFMKVVDAIDKNENPVPIYKQAVQALNDNKVEEKDLKLFVKLSKNPLPLEELARIKREGGKPLPEFYAGNCTSNQIGLLHNGKMGDVLWFYRARKGSTLDYSLLDKEKYIAQYTSTVKDAIEIFGYNLETGEKKNKGLQQVALY